MAEKLDPRETDFKEIGHSGGKITFSIKVDDQGHPSYQIGWSSNRPVPAVIFAIYALPQGIPVGVLQLGGIVRGDLIIDGKAAM